MRSLFLLLEFFLLLLPTSLTLAAPSKPHLSPTFSNLVIFDPPDNYTDPQVLYARSLLLDDGTLLATWENYSPEPPLVYFPIYKSTDGGHSWEEIARVTDQVNNWGLRYQPFLYQLRQPLGGYHAGTILLAGNSIPTNLSNTQIDVYASTDAGHSWEFVSHVAAGGEALPNNGLTPVWEPFLMEYEGRIIIYYSDQRDPAHGQKLVHQESTNLREWGPIVDDVAYATYTARPGMTTIAGPLPNGQYILTYEYGGAPEFSTYQFPVYYRLSADPTAFNEAEGLPVKPASGSQPIGSPYVTWSPVGGKNGTIIVSSGSNTPIYVNRALGAVDAWEQIETSEPVSYTRGLRVLKDPSLLLIIGGGHLPPSTTNTVHAGVLDLKTALGI